MEDDDNQRALLSTLLEESEMEVLECDSAEAGDETVSTVTDPVGLMMLIVAVAFFVGMIAGSIIFPSQQPVQSASTDGRTALAFLLNGSRTEPR